MTYLIFNTVIILHFLFDWVLQPRHIAKAKGMTDEGIRAVFQHLIINILPFSICFGGILWFLEDPNILLKLYCNFILHGLIDIFLPKGKNERQMINWTAVDQILHITLLFTLMHI